MAVVAPELKKKRKFKELDKIQGTRWKWVTFVF